VNELRGEKIDVIRWSPDPATYIANALSPARVEQVILVNPEEMQAHVLVPDDQLSLAIGKEGQNVRLAARLTGWKIDIKDSAKYDFEAESRKMAELAEQRKAEQAARALEEDDYEDEEYEDEDEDVTPAELEEAIAYTNDEDATSADGFGVASASALQRPDVDA
jgi:N utilization substance protein A